MSIIDLDRPKQLKEIKRLHALFEGTAIAAASAERSCAFLLGEYADEDGSTFDEDDKKEIDAATNRLGELLGKINELLTSC
jgi:hypothetical protein